MKEILSSVTNLPTQSFIFSIEREEAFFFKERKRKKKTPLSFKKVFFFHSLFFFHHLSLNKRNLMSFKLNYKKLISANFLHQQLVDCEQVAGGSRTLLYGA